MTRLHKLDPILVMIYIYLNTSVTQNNNGITSGTIVLHATSFSLQWSVSDYITYVGADLDNDLYIPHHLKTIMASPMTRTIMLHAGDGIIDEGKRERT